MKTGKFYKLRVWLTAAACLCFLTVFFMGLWGVQNEITDGMILVMEIIGAAGILAFGFNAAFAVRELFLFFRSKRSDKSSKT